MIIPVIQDQNKIFTSPTSQLIIFPFTIFWDLSMHHNSCIAKHGKIGISLTSGLRGNALNEAIRAILQVILHPSSTFSTLSLSPPPTLQVDMCARAASLSMHNITVTSFLPNLLPCLFGCPGPPTLKSCSLVAPWLIVLTLLQLFMVGWWYSILIRESILSLFCSCSSLIGQGSNVAHSLHFWLGPCGRQHGACLSISRPMVPFTLFVKLRNQKILRCELESDPV